MIVEYLLMRVRVVGIERLGAVKKVLDVVSGNLHLKSP
jgi:hypothetical protein